MEDDRLDLPCTRLGGELALLHHLEEFARRVMRYVDDTCCGRTRHERVEQDHLVAHFGQIDHDRIVGERTVQHPLGGVGIEQRRTPARQDEIVGKYARQQRLAGAAMERGDDCSDVVGCSADQAAAAVRS